MDCCCPEFDSRESQSNAVYILHKYKLGYLSPLFVFGLNFGESAVENFSADLQLSLNIESISALLSIFSYILSVKTIHAFEFLTQIIVMLVDSLYSLVLISADLITNFLFACWNSYTKALEVIKKLHKDQAQEIKTYKLKLENLQTLRDAAYKVIIPFDVLFFTFSPFCMYGFHFSVICATSLSSP